MGIFKAFQTGCGIEGAGRLVVKLFRLRLKTGFNIVDAAATGQLSKSHAQKPVLAAECSDPVVAILFFDQHVELTFGKVAHDLGKDLFLVYLVLPKINKTTSYFPKIQVDTDANASLNQYS